MKLSRPVKLALHFGLIALTGVLVLLSGEIKSTDMSFLVLAVVIELT